MTTTTLPRRRYGNEAPSPAMLLPEGVDLPKPVRAASDRARKLYEAWQQDGHALREAERSLKAAAPADAPAAAGRVAEARQARDVSAEAAIEAHFDLRDAIVEHRDELAAARREAIEAQGARITGLLDELRQAVGRLRFERVLLEGIERVHITLDTLDFRVPQPDTPAAHRRRERVEKIERDRPRAPGDSRHTVPRETDHLLVALAVTLEEELGKQPDDLPAESRSAPWVPAVEAGRRVA